MCHASLPDPSWLGGYWDDADFDDVILFLAESTVGALPAQPILGESGGTVVGLVGRIQDGPDLEPSSSPLSTRAPPAA